MQKYINAVADKNGKPVSGASVLVQNYPSGTTASIYSDNGSTAQSNPMSTDPNGGFAFYAADGRYTLQISGSGIVTQTISDVLLEDPTDGGSPGSFTTLTVSGSATIGGGNALTTSNAGAPGTAALIGSSAGTVQTDIDARPTSSTLAASGGAALVGDASGTTVGDRLNATNLADYTALRAYAGSAKSVYVTGYLVSANPSGIAGTFTRDDSDTTSADNGGTIIVASNGKRWKRVYSGAIYPEWFGVQSGVDCTTQWAAMRSWWAGKDITLRLQDGATYYSANNRWFYGAKRIVVNGNATLICTRGTTNGSDYVENCLACVFTGWFSNVGSGYYTGVEDFQGYKIASANSGDQTVTLTEGSTSDYQVGGYALVYGYDQQGSVGSPPNPRFFEVRKIQSIAGSTITFETTLKYFYNSAWPDTDGSSNVLFGAPRCLSLNRSNFLLTEYAELNGVNFGANSGWVHANASGRNGRLIGQGVLTLVINGCTVPTGVQTYLGGCSSIEVSNVRWVGGLEIDKILGKIRVKDSLIGSGTDGTGCMVAEYDNVEFVGSQASDAKNQKHTNCKYNCLASGTTTAYYNIGALMSVNSVEIENPTFVCNSVTSGRNGLLFDNLNTAVTVGTVLSPNSFSITKSTFNTNNVMRTLYPGAVGVIMTGATSTGKRFVVTDAYQSGTDIVITGKAIGKLVAGEIYTFDMNNSLSVDNVRIVGTQTPWLFSSNASGLTNTDGIGKTPMVNRRDTRKVVLTQDDLVNDGVLRRYFPVRSKIVRITVDIIEPYRGATTGALLRVGTRNADSSNATWLSIDLSTQGARFADIFGNKKQLGTDAYTTPVDNEMLYANAYYSAVLADAGGELPVFTVVFELA